MSHGKGRGDAGASPRPSPDRGEAVGEPTGEGPRLEQLGHAGHADHAGLDRIVRAAGYSLSGLRAALRSETAFRQEVFIAAVLTPLAFWLGHDWAETALLVASLLLVLIVELLNSALEAAVDRVSLDRHELSKRAKDLASAAVFLTLLLCAGLWLSALWQRVASGLFS